MPTTREVLEAKATKLRQYADELAAKTPTPNELTKLGAMTDELNAYNDMLGATKAVDALSGAGTGPFADLSLSALGSPPGATGPVLSAKTGRLGAPPLAFSEDEIEGLRSAAQGAQMKSISVKTTSTNVPMSTIGQYESSVFPFLRDKVRLLDYIPMLTTDQPSVWYHRATVAASAADTVAEGADKPLSAPEWERVEAPVEKIAHYGTVNDEVIADFPAFVRVVGGEFLSGLMDAETDQLINGSGVSPDLTGLLLTTGIQTRAKGADIHIDALFRATNDLRTGPAFCEPDTIIIHPDDLADVILSKDSSGNYIVGPPTETGRLMLWGVPIVPTTRIAAGTAIVANLKMAALVYMRQAPVLEVNPYGGLAEWKANKTLIRAEERLSLTVPYPKAIVKVTGL